MIIAAYVSTLSDPVTRTVKQHIHKPSLSHICLICDYAMRLSDETIDILLSVLKYRISNFPRSENTSTFRDLLLYVYFFHF